MQIPLKNYIVLHYNVQNLYYAAVTYMMTLFVFVKLQTRTPTINSSDVTNQLAWH